MRKSVALSMAAAALVALAGPAQAGSATAPATSSVQSASSTAWTPFKRVLSSPTVLTGACRVPIRATFPIDHVVQRTRKDAGGNTLIESKGRLVITLTPKNHPGQHYTFDISGPSLGRDAQIAFANGDYLYRATGTSVVLFFGTAVVGTGMPRLGLTQGEVAVLYTGTTKSNVITRPRSVIDLCRLMHVGSA